MTEFVIAPPPHYSPEEINGIWARTGLNFQEFADLLGAHRRTTSSWCSGNATPRPPAMRLLSIVDQLGYRGLRQSASFHALREGNCISGLRPDGIKGFREGIGLSRPEFAAVFGITEDAVKLWEAGKVGLKGTNLRLLQYLDKMGLEETLNPTKPTRPGRFPDSPTPADIRDLRLSLGLSTKEFSGKLLISASIVSAWERGASKPLGPTVILMRLLSRDGIGILERVKRHGLNGHEIAQTIDRHDLSNAELARQILSSPPSMTRMVREGAKGPAAMVVDLIDQYGPVILHQRVA